MHRGEARSTGIGGVALLAASPILHSDFQSGHTNLAYWLWHALEADATNACAEDDGKTTFMRAFWVVREDPEELDSRTYEITWKLYLRC